jgi:hypothetical protein
MTTIERTDRNAGPVEDIAVTIVDTDVHPMPVSADVLSSYAPKDWVDKIWPSGNAVTPTPHFYDTPDSFKTMSLRVDAFPPGGRMPGIDPDFAPRQLLVDAGVSIATLEPMCDAQLPDDPADAGDSLRQSAFRPHLRGRIAERPTGRHPLDGPDAVRVDSDVPGGQCRALARLLRLLAAAVRVSSDEPGLRRGIRQASRLADRVRRGSLHLGDAGDVADGPHLGGAPFRPSARPAPALRQAKSSATDQRLANSSRTAVNPSSSVE